MPSPSRLVRLGVIAALMAALGPAVAAASADDSIRYVAGTFLVHGDPGGADLSGHAIKGDLHGYQLTLRLVEATACDSENGCAVYGMHWLLTKDHDVLWGGCWKHRRQPTCSAGYIDPNSGDVTLVGNVQGGVGGYGEVIGGEVHLRGHLLPGSDVLPAVGSVRMTLALRS